MTDTKDPLAQSDLHNARGIELADRGWLDEAANEFRKAIELDPKSAHAHDNLATVHAEKGRYREALAEYLTALELEPDSPTAHYNLACFLSSHSLDMAVGEYQRAIEEEPGYRDAHVNLGITYADMGKYDEAKASLKTAIELEPEDTFARLELADLYMDDEELRDAIGQLKEVTRIDPNEYEGFLNLGICYAQKGFYAEAERCYLRALELNSQESLIPYNLSALYALWGRLDDCVRFMRQAAALSRDEVLAWLAEDNMFDAVRELPEFQASLEAVPPSADKNGGAEDGGDSAEADLSKPPSRED